MFVQHRLDEITTLLKENGSVKVKELSEKFQVSDDLIRKDLAKLEKNGICNKAYGGAVLAKKNLHMTYVSQRRNLNIETKKELAKEALKLINEHNMVFLDLSSTNIELARLIKNTKITVTVVTNSIDILNVLVDSDIELIFLGGNINKTRDGFFGSIENELIEKFNFDIAFIGAVGIDIENNVMQAYDVEDAVSKQMAIKHSKKQFLLIEADKFNYEGNVNYAKLSDITGLICDNCSINNKDKLLEYNLLVININKK
jgi:DeoR family glycerol-3-phosphate regulon repressor